MCFQRSSGWIDQSPPRGLRRSGDGVETEVGERISVRTDSKTRTFGSCATAESGTRGWARWELGIESQELARKDRDAG